MSIKLVSYSLFIPLSIYVVTSIKLEKYFRKNSAIQINLFYIFLSGVLSYLVVNFIIDIYSSVVML